MSSEITQAFEHPLARSEATGAAFLDRISVRDHVVEVEIGAFQLERGVTQRISFDVVVEVRASTGAETDDVDDILSYDRVTEAIENAVFAERLNLLETLAEKIAISILAEPPAMRVFVRIQKLDRGAGKLGVEIVRSKAEVNADQAKDDAPKPIVVHLNDTKLSASSVDKLKACKVPIVLTVGKISPVKSLSAPIAQRRVALLAIEQEAWKLAAQDPRLIVVDSWTELDWGLKNDQISIWAPSKTVFDSPDEEIAGVEDPQALSEWLASELSAQRHVVLEDQNQLSEEFLKQ